MRILAIRGCNLASLEGDFAVELDSEPLASAGLFVITGPTGSGKSTILDALCLALFDRVPRLPDDRRTTEVGRADSSLGERIKSNDVRTILRHGTGEGHAEVDFLANDGRRYRSRWSLHRARNRPTGRLQAQEMRLEDLASGELIGGTKTEVLGEISARLGLTFDQFRRSVLLAQGDFAAFLRAEPKARSELLERITGTEIYSRLSVAAHERERDERQALAQLETQLGELAVLGADAKAELEARVLTDESALKEAEAKVDAARRDLDWHDRLGRLLEDEAEIAEARDTAERLWTEAQELRSELDAVEAAVPAKPHLEAFDRSLARFESAKAEMAHADEHSTAANQAAVEAAAVEKQALDALQEATAERQRRRPEVAEARTIETALHGTQAALDRRIAEVEKLADELGDRRGAHEALLRRGSELSEVHDAARTWLAENEHLGALGDRWQRWQTVLEGLCLQHRELEEASQKHHDLSGLRDEAEQRLLDARSAEEAARSVRREEIGRLRAMLAEGEPCPVCGATDHPAIHSGDGVEEPLPPTESAAGPSPSDPAPSLDVEQLQQQHTDLVADVSACAATRQQLLNGVGAALDALSEPLAEVAGWRELAQSDPLELAERTKQWAHEWTDHRQQHEQTATALDRHEEDVSASAASLSADEAAFGAANEKVLEGEHKLAELRDRLTALTDGRGADELADDLERAEADARENVARARADLARAGQVTAAAEQTLKSARKVVVDLEREVDRARSELDAAVASLDIDHDELRRLLDHEPSWLESERRRMGELKQRRKEDEIRLSEKRAAVAEHRTQAPSAATAEAARAAAVEAEQCRNEALDSLSASRLSLARDDEAVEKRKALELTVKDRSEQWRTWAALKDVIGSADGSKLRRFAQSLTLEALLGHANIYLGDLARRFALQRVPDSDLELQVVDNDMADEVRSVFSLSGGESFLVSLALALGLASLNSRRTKVESLFIDEGFGSLDADALETAVASLDALQSLGRQVGIISHVATMVERIGTQVEVRSAGSGRSSVRVTDPLIQ